MAYDPISGNLGLGGGVTITPSGQLVYNVGGTSTPIGNARNKTGVFAPRLTADAAARAADAQRPATKPSVGGMYQTNPNVIPKGYMDAETGIAIAKSEELDNAMKAAENAANATANGSGGRNPYTDAIRVLQQQISGGQYGSSFDRLSAQLGRTGTQARREIDAASLAAIAGLSSQDPMSQYTYAPSTAQIPQTALSDYLTSIGAGTNEVNANRDFLQQMINSENAQAMQYTNEITQAQNAQRDAAIQAVYGNQAYAKGQLGTAQQAQEFAIKAAREAELKKLQDQIMQYTLQGGKR